MRKSLPCLRFSFIPLLVVAAIPVLLPAQAPSNDNCSGAITLVPAAGINCAAPISGTTVGATQSIAPITCSGYTSSVSEDVWYRFTATYTTHQITVTAISNFDIVLDVRTGTCNGANIACADNLASGAEVLTLNNLTIGASYLLRVYGYINGPSSQGIFTICVTTPLPPPYDECAGAIQLPVHNTCVFSTYSTTNATASNIPDPDCASYNGGDVWFKVTVPANGKLQLEGDAIDFSDGAMALYSGMCSGLTLIECDDDDGINAMPYINRSNLTPGSTVYIRFWEYGNDSHGQFGICAYEPSAPSNFQRDLRVAQILFPQSGCNRPAQQTVRVRIENLGTQAQSGFPVRYIANGDTVTETVGTNIPAGGSLEYSFSQQTNLPVSAGGYTIQALTLLPNEQNTANDNTTALYYNLPQFDAGVSAAVSICQGNGTYISAYGGSGAQYAWSNNLGTYSSAFVAPNSSTSYTVTVTNSLGCTDVDTVAVTVLPLPAQPVISYSGSAPQFCQGGGSVTLSSSIATNIVWNTGATTQSITVSQAGTYWVRHTNEFGCSSTSAWVYVSAVPAPVLSTQSVGGAVCPGGSDKLTVSTGAGVYTYDWSTGIKGTNNITVTPAFSTTYTVTVTNVSLGCVYVLSKTIQVLSNAPPGPVTNMLPVNGATNVASPANLSWAPASNASHYDVYVWRQGDSPPSNATFQIAQINVLYYPAQYGTTYNWRVVPKTPCATGTTSATQTFTSAPPADFIVTAIEVPSGAVFSGTEATFTWMVDNIGAGTAGATYWYDAVYLSPDSSCATGNNDQYLGGRKNPTLLQPNDPPYTNSLSYTLPNGTEGLRYVLVRADYSNNAAESNENNNCRVAAIPLMIELTPPPDLRVVCEQVVWPGVAGTVQAGQTYGMSWTVRNQGLGPTISGGWYDRVYLSKDTLLSIGSDVLLAAHYRNVDLDVNQTYTVSANVAIPAYLSGDYYIFILTDINNQEYEHNFEFNNTCRSGALNANAIPRPNFLASVLSATPSTVDNNESIVVSWQTSNEGAPYNGTMTDAILLHTQASLGLGFPTSLGTHSYSANLPTGASVTQQRTIQIPAAVNGPYFIIVKADGNGAVAEADETDNAQNAQAITVQSPNLSVLAASIAFPSNMVSGQQFPVAWNVRNTGPGKMLGATLSDRISLSATSNGANPIPIGFKSEPTSLFVNGVQGRQGNFALPNTLSGTYYVVVHTNYNNAVFEAGQTADNIAVSSQPVTIALADFPDLRPTAAPNAPPAAQAGQSIAVTYDVANDGSASVVNAWQDRIYLRNSPVWGLSGSTLLQSVPRSQVLPSGQTYTENNVYVAIPATTTAGQYYLFVVIDAGNSIFEHTNENNNVSPGRLINIATVLDVDLAIQPTLVPATVTPGVPALINWKVTNTGNSSTPVGTWNDRLYLSSTPNWPPIGPLLATFPHGGTLGAGQSYSASGYFTVPVGQTGTYYLLLVTDPEQTTADNFFSNNHAALAPSGGGGTIVITYPPAPDLIVTSVNAPEYVQAGQPAKVAYTVKNNGPGSYNGPITDAVFRSTDLVVNASDVQLASKSGMHNLPSGASYSDTLEIIFPATDSGNVLVLVKTNANNIIGEANLNNNTNFDYIVVQPPPPADLVVENVAALPSPIQIGNDLTVLWTLRNVGSNPVTGIVRDGVYLSQDQIWDADDLLLGTLGANLALTPGNTLNRSFSARVEGVENTLYWVIVRTDIFNNYPEEDENNNLATGGPVQVEIPELPIGIPTPAALPKEKPIYYRIEVPANLAGEMLSVEITSPDNTAFNELYLRYGRVPSRTTYDFVFDQPFSPNQRLIVPALQAGTYYVMAYAPDGPSQQSVTLLAKIVPFALESVQADKGGNTGSVTVLVRGTKFDPAMQLWLENSAGTIVQPSGLSYVNNLSAYVTFPLNGVQPGKFDVRAVNSAQNAAVLPDGFEVVAGTVGNQPPPSLSCSFGNGFVPLVLNAQTPFAYEVQHPASARPNQIVAMTFRMENTGSVDIPVPKRILTSVGGAPLSVSTNDLGQDLKELQLEFSEANAPPEILRPGGVSYRTIYTKAIREMQFNVLE